MAEQLLASQEGLGSVELGTCSFYICEMRFITRRKVYTLPMFESKVIKKIFGSKKDEIITECLI